MKREGTLKISEDCSGLHKIHCSAWVRSGCRVSSPGSPGLWVGPACAHESQRNLGRADRLQLCISPEFGPVERGYGAAVARRACRLSQIAGAQA
jgi:hypothetical protein